jgi:hypothetical protein
VNAPPELFQGLAGARRHQARAWPKPDDLKRRWVPETPPNARERLAGKSDEAKLGLHQGFPHLQIERRKRIFNQSERSLHRIRHEIVFAKTLNRAVCGLLQSFACEIDRLPDTHGRFCRLTAIPAKLAKHGCHCFRLVPTACDSVFQRLVEACRRAVFRRIGHLPVGSSDVARLIKWPARHCEKFEWGASLETSRHFGDSPRASSWRLARFSARLRWIQSDIHQQGSLL